MKDGFIVISRKMLKWEWYQDSNTKSLFIHLLLMANWENKKWQGIEVKRGSLITSIKHLSEQTGLTIRQIRTSLNKLIMTSEITKSSTNKYTVITINNYNKYQDNDKQDDKQDDKQATSKRQQLNNNNNITNKQYNIYNNNIYDFVQENFGRLLSSAEYEEISTWEDNELTRYAIKQSVLNNKCSIRYILTILNAYQRENIKTVQQAQEREREYMEAKGKTKKNYKTSTEKMNDVFERFLKEEK